MIEAGEVVQVANNAWRVQGSQHPWLVLLTQRGWYCACPGWLFGKTPTPQRVCKHVKQVQSRKEGWR